jgi:acylphosphatase
LPLLQERDVEMTQHLNIRVVGKVQGVFYRASALEKAQELGLYGFVRNEPDESVYLEAEGAPEQLEKLVNWCRQGPPRAKVEQVDVRPGEWQGFTRFEIKR